MSTLLARKTYDDLALMPDDGNRYELLDGEIVMSPAPNADHFTVARHLFRLLDAWVVARQLGEAGFAPFDVRLDESTTVQPDVWFLSNERAARFQFGAMEGAPDLAVEVVSPSTIQRDGVDKLRLYATLGVREYWLVDPAARTFQGFALADGVATVIMHDGATFRSIVVEGFAVDLGALFAGLLGPAPG